MEYSRSGFKARRPRFDPRTFGLATLGQDGGVVHFVLTVSTVFTTRYKLLNPSVASRLHYYYYYYYYYAVGRFGGDQSKHRLRLYDESNKSNQIWRAGLIGGAGVGCG